MKMIFDPTMLSALSGADSFMVCTHVRPDGDAIGSTKGLQRILQLSYPEKDIRLINADSSDYLAFLGGEDAPVEDEFYKSALAIVVDTGTTDRISNKKFALCREIAKIDHHIDDKPYGNAAWIEEERSSSCEMIAHFYNTFRDRLKIDSEAATYLYTGMVTDSGRFRYRDVTGETMRLAGMLLDVGVDTEHLYANLYMKEIHNFRFQAAVYKKMKITENGVAYLHVTKRMKKKFGLTNEDASASVSYLDSIKGSLIWLAFIDGDDGKIRVRLRSRFVQVHDLATKYHGGGHACASGATVYSKAELKALVADADALLKEYKENNTGWI